MVSSRTRGHRGRCAPPITPTMGSYADAFLRSQPAWRRWGARFVRGLSLGPRGVSLAARCFGFPRVAEFVEGLVASGHPCSGRTAGWSGESPRRSSGPDRPVISVIGSLAPGGAERQLAIYLAASASLGLARHEVVTFRPCDGVHGHLLPRIEASGARVRSMGAVGDAVATETIRTDADLRRRLRLVPALLRPQVVDLAGEFLHSRPRVVHAWLDHANILAGIAALVVGVPRVVMSLRSVHPGNFPQLHRSWMLPWYRVLVADGRVRLVANSRAGAGSYASWIGIDPKRILVVPNAVDPETMISPSAERVAEVRREVGAGPGERIVCGVLRLSEEKQPILFAEVARAVCRSDATVRFVLVGDGPMRSSIESTVAELGDRVVLLGSRKDAAAIMAASDVVLLTSRIEGTPNVLLEAQALGTPVVATRVGGVEDAVLDGSTGLLRAWNDADGLVDAVRSLLADDRARGRLGEAGRTWVQERFSVEAMVTATNTLYE